MLSRLKSVLSGTDRPRYASVVLVILRTTKHNYEYNALHVVPEDGSVERISFASSSAKTFRNGSAEERAREQLGIVFLKEDDDGNEDYPGNVLTELESQITRLLKAKETSENPPSLQTIEQTFRSVAQDMIQQREGMPPTAHPYQVLLVQVDRTRPGRIKDSLEPTSFPRH